MTDLERLAVSYRERNERRNAVWGVLNAVGTPYLWGGDDPEEGLDCSGLILHVYNRFCGYGLPDMTADGLRQMTYNFHDPADTRMGDLAFYGKARATHVVMVIAPYACVVVGANNGTSFKSVGIQKSMPRQLTEEERLIYANHMGARGAGVQVEDEGFAYRKDFLCFGQMPVGREIDARPN